MSAHAIGVTDPLVSVIMPTYNRARVLPRAVRSVLDQTYRNLELLIVDDGSTDETAAVVASFDDPRVKYLELAGRTGAPRARNHGIERARGQLIGLQDSDDEWHPHKLARQVPRLTALPASTALTYTALTRVTSNGRVRIPSRTETRPLSGRLCAALIRGNFISTQTVLVRANVLRSAGGFDPQMPRLQEWDLWLTLCQTYDFDVINEELATVYESADSISLDSAAYVAALGRIAEKHEALLRSMPRERSNLLLSLAVLTARQRARRRAVGYALAALRASPPTIAGRLRRRLSRSARTEGA